MTSDALTEPPAAARRTGRQRQRPGRPVRRGGRSGTRADDRQDRHPRRCQRLGHRRAGRRGSVDEAGLRDGHRRHADRWPSTSCICPRRYIPMQVPAAGHAVPPRLRASTRSSYTVYLSTTNYGTGNSSPRTTPSPDRASRSAPATGRHGTTSRARRGDHGPFAGFVLTDPEGNVFLGTADGADRADRRGRAQIGTAGAHVRRRLRGAQPACGRRRQDRAADIDPDVRDADRPRTSSIRAHRRPAVEIQRRAYDPELDAIVDMRRASSTRPRTATSSPRTAALSPGCALQRRARQLRHVFTTRGSTNRSSACWRGRSSSPSRRSSHVRRRPAAGDGVQTSDERARLYRGLIVIPYAMPSFMTALVWQGMLNRSSGINKWLGVDLTGSATAMAPYRSILIVNLWLGYPYMFLVCTGALQGIPTTRSKPPGSTEPPGARRFARSRSHCC